MFYPVMLNLKDKLVTVVGGGEVALRKVYTLLEFDADIRVISPEFQRKFTFISDKVELVQKDYYPDLISGSFFVIAATSSTNVNSEIALYCKDNKILCNIVDNMNDSDITIPSTLKRGDLVISVSTFGKSPALAARIKQKLKNEYTEDFGKYVDLLGDIRLLVQKNCKDIKERRKILNDILDLSYEELILWKRNFEGGK